MTNPSISTHLSSAELHPRLSRLSQGGPHGRVRARPPRIPAAADAQARPPNGAAAGAGPSPGAAATAPAAAAILRRRRDWRCRPRRRRPVRWHCRQCWPTAGVVLDRPVWQHEPVEFVLAVRPRTSWFVEFVDDNNVRQNVRD